MGRRFLLLVAIAVVVVAGFAGRATAQPASTIHRVVQHDYQGLTFVAGLGSCDLFHGVGGFRDVDLRDSINEFMEAVEGGPLFIHNSVATLSGVINTPDGQYTVAGHFVEENGLREIGHEFIGTSGHATISGPTGVVSGTATFRDLYAPAEFDLYFTSVTVCNLK